MEVEVVVIVKGLTKTGAPKILMENNLLPSFRLSGDNHIYIQLGNFLRDNFEIPNGFVCFSFVDLSLQNHVLRLFYTTFAPLEFLNEETVAKFNTSYDQLEPMVLEKVKQALRLFHD